jgi:general secretion pathway protein L
VSLSELLSADVNTIWPWARSGIAWWLGELAAMLPAPARAAFEMRPSLTAEPLAEGGYRLTRHGRTVMQSPGATGRPRPVTLRLPRDAALIRQAPAPPVADRDLRRMLQLDIDRLTPFRAEQVFVDVIPGEAGSRTALVAAIPRERAIEALQQAVASGLDPRALGVDGATPAELALDFLPRMREAKAAPSRGVSPALVWSVVAALVLANLAVAIGRDMLRLHDLRQQIEAQQPQVADAQALRRKVLSETRRRSDILRRRATGDPLRVVDALTAALPPGVWVDRLAWDGKSVRIGGYRQEQIDVAAALRGAPQVSNLRNSGTEILTRQAAGLPFDLTADIRPPAAR